MSAVLNAPLYREPVEFRAVDDPGSLMVTESGDGRTHHIFSDYSALPGVWEDIYVDFSGFFGSYGPEVFAAAPELRDALRELLEAFTAKFPCESCGKEAQDSWGNRQTAAKDNAVALLAKVGAAS